MLPKGNIKVKSQYISPVRWIFIPQRFKDIIEALILERAPGYK